MTTNGGANREIEYLVVTVHVYSLGKFAFLDCPGGDGAAVPVREYPTALQFLLKQLGRDSWQLLGNPPFSLNRLGPGDEGVIVFMRMCSS